MDILCFEATFGDERKTVRVSKPVGMDSEAYQVSIDYYHQGIILYRDGWIGYLNDRSILTAEDIAILGEMIEGLNK